MSESQKLVYCINYIEAKLLTYLFQRFLFKAPSRLLHLLLSGLHNHKTRSPWREAFLVQLGVLRLLDDGGVPSLHWGGRLRGGSLSLSLGRAWVCRFSARCFSSSYGLLCSCSCGTVNYRSKWVITGQCFPISSNGTLGTDFILLCCLLFSKV